MKLACSVALVALLVLCPAALGQAHAPGHGGHGPDAAPAPDASLRLPPPPLMDGIDRANFPITTSSPRAQDYFNQGVALLHSFWDFEALRSFREASRLDPEAPMPYWGVYQAIRPFDRRRAAARKAAAAKIKELLDKASERERYYLRAALALEERGERGRAAHVREMEALVDRYPDDVDAKLFLALFLMSGYDKERRPKEGHSYSQAILRGLLHTHPDSFAVHHYWMHAVESGPRPADALASAERLRRLKPRAGHLVHMPGHIFYRTGDYERARAAFLDAVRVDEEYMRAQGVPASETWNYTHNLNYLVAACAEMGRYREAVEVTEKLRSLPPDAEGMKTSAAFVMDGGGTQMRLHIRFGKWQAVLDNPLTFGVDDAGVNEYARAYRDGLRLYAAGMAAVEGGRPEAAEREADRFDAQLWRLTSAEKPPPAGSPPAEILKVLTLAALELRGNLLSARGLHDEAITLLKQAVERERELPYVEPPVYSRPSLESLGHAYLRAGRWQLARGAFEEVLRERPRSGHALYGIARSYALEGGKEREAARAYEAFLKSWAGADPDLPQVLEARSFRRSPARDSAAAPAAGREPSR